MDFRIDVPDLSIGQEWNDAHALFEEAMQEFVLPVLETVMQDASQATPYDRIAQAYTITDLGDDGGAHSWEVTNTDDHWAFVEFDMPPHTISAVNAPYLWFPVADGWVRTKSVNHPGHAGGHYLQGAWDDNADGIAEGVDQALDYMLTNWGFE